MKIVIDIPEEIYDKYMNYTEHYIDFMFFGTEEKIVRAIRNSTPLPKNHGRLIDADEAKENMMYAMCGTGYQTRAMSVLNEYHTQTIIEAESEEEE